MRMVNIKLKSVARSRESRTESVIRETGIESITGWRAYSSIY